MHPTLRAYAIGVKITAVSWPEKIAKHIIQQTLRHGKQAPMCLVTPLKEACLVLSGDK